MFSRKPVHSILLASAAASLAVTGLAQNVAASANTIRSSRPAICSKSYDPYRASATLLSSCGDEIMRLQSVTSLPGGGKAYHYGQYTELLPPARFNVLKASDKTLAEYGLPTRKKLGRQWYGVMRHFRHFLPAPSFLVGVPVSADALNDTCPTGSCNWDGHYVSGHTYDEVTGTWKEPHFVGAGCSGDAFSNWAGMGGISSKDSLGQVGTNFNAPGFAAHQGFILTIINGAAGNGDVPIQGFVPSAGDTIYASVLWNSPHYYYLLNDQTTNTSSGSILSRTDDSPDNSTAEFISERPLINGSLSELSDFQTIAFQDATSYWSTGSAGFYNNPVHKSIQMSDLSSQGGHTLATTTNLDSDSNFTNTWKRCS